VYVFNYTFLTIESGVMVTNNFNGNNNIIIQNIILVNPTQTTSPNQTTPPSLFKRLFKHIKSFLSGMINIVLFIYKLPIGLISIFF